MSEFRDQHLSDFWTQMRIEKHHICLPHMVCTGCSRTQSSMLKSKMSCQDSRKLLRYEGCAPCGTRKPIER